MIRPEVEVVVEGWEVEVALGARVLLVTIQFVTEKFAFI